MAISRLTFVALVNLYIWLTVAHPGYGLVVSDGATATTRRSPPEFQKSSLRSSDTKDLILSRRGVFQSALSTGGMISSVLTFSCSSANAFGFFEAKQRRQLELCLVNVMRLAAWAQVLSQELRELEGDDRRSRYLEVRLGAKACLTKKIGGGSSLRVYTLASLELPSCLEDLEYYSRPNSRRVDDFRRDLIEALGSIVEFDGLESLIDQSPRSSLTIQQYNNDKALFVQRMLSERVVPIANDLIHCFPSETIVTAEKYMKEYYSSELPPTKLEPEGLL